MTMEITTDNEVILYSSDGGRIKSLGYLSNEEETKRVIYRAMKFGEELAREQIRSALGII